MLSFARRSFTASVAGKKVGFLGLGNMGLPMATNLKKAGFDVTGYDVGEKQRQSAAEASLDIATSIEEAVKGADFIITALPKTEHVEAVLK